MTIPLLSFTPSAQDPGVLEELLVGRAPLLRAIMADVAALLDDSADRHHRLVLGPRGIGKSHVLALVAHRSMARYTRDQLHVAWLPEDIWGVLGFRDLATHIVDAVSPELGKLSVETDEELDRLLRSTIARTPTLLLIENLDELVASVGRPGIHRLRAIAEDLPLLIIGAATQIFDEVRKGSEPLYGFFDVHHLAELTLEEAAQLLQNVARLRKDEELLTFLGTDVARRRIQAVAALAGGHPRIWMLFAGCLSITALDTLVPLFLESLDDLTPYYQSRIHQLPRQQQAIVMAICRHAGALSNRDIAATANIGDRQTANALRDLERKGYVRRAELPRSSRGDRRLSWWELREPLMRLSLDMKQARGEPLRIVVNFLREWYGLRLHLERGHFAEDSLGERYVSAALRDPLHMDWEALSLAIGSLSRHDQAALIGCVIRDRRSDLPRLLASLDGPISSDLRAAIIEARDDEAVLAALDEALALDALNVGVLELKARLLRELQRYSEIVDLLTPAMSKIEPPVALWTELAGGLRGTDRNLEAEALLRTAADRFPSDSWVQHELGWTYEALGQLQEALGAYERAAELSPDSAPDSDLVNHQVSVLTRMKRPGEAIERAQSALIGGRGTSRSYRHLGVAFGSAGQPLEAANALQEATLRDPEDAGAQFFLGTALLELARFDDALDARRRAMELEPTSVRYQYGYANALERVGNLGGALDIYRSLSSAEPAEPHHLFHLAGALASVKSLDEALKVVERLTTVGPEVSNNWVERARIELLAGQAANAGRSIDRALELSPDDAQIRFRKARVLFDLRDAAWPNELGQAAQKAIDAGQSISSDVAQWIRLVARLSPDEWPAAVAHLERAFADLAPAALGASIPAAISSLPRAEDIALWREAWAGITHRDAAFDLGMSLLAAAANWLRDRNPSHLMRLPAEQRSILEALLSTRTEAIGDPDD